MKEANGNIWDHIESPNVIICLTTNGFVKKKTDECVMGKGNALEAKRLYPSLPQTLGRLILKNGNIVQEITNKIIAFPVKHNWYEDADIELIVKSASSLAIIANDNKNLFYLLPRPGCGNGKLKWSFVKPYIEEILPDNVIVVTNE